MVGVNILVKYTIDAHFKIIHNGSELQTLKYKKWKI